MRKLIILLAAAAAIWQWQRIEYWLMRLYYKLFPADGIVTDVIVPDEFSSYQEMVKETWNGQ
jgi:hypothetical protein